MRSVQHKKGHT